MRGQWTARVSLTLVLSCPIVALAQTAVPVWQRTFRPAPAGGPGSSGVIASRELADGTFLVVTYDLASYHFAADGSPLGSQALPVGPLSKRPALPRPNPIAAPAGEAPGYLKEFAAIDAFGGVVVSRVGEPDYSPYPFTGDILTTKFDGLTGRALWARPAIYDTAGFFSADYPTGVYLDGAGNVIVTGLTVQNAGLLSHVTVKYDGQTGAVLWGPAVLGSVLSAGTASVDSSGNVFVSVARLLAGGSAPRFTTLEYASINGMIVWGPVATNGSDFQYPMASAVSTSGDLFIVGGMGSDYGVMKLQVWTGAVVWTSTVPIPGQGSAQATTVALDSRGDVLVSGGGSSAAATLKLSGSSGAVVWGPVIEDGATAPSSLSMFGNGDVFIDPPTAAYPPTLQLARYHGSDGSVAWGPIPVGSSYFDPYTSPSAFVASNGNVFVASDFVVSSTAVTQALEADGATGGLAWGPVNLVPPTVGRAYLDDLSAGTDGTLAVTGHDFDTGQVLTFKYDRATGTPLWGPISYGSSDARASASQSAVDASGNVLVFGSTSEAPGGGYVIKYAAAGGSVLWGPTVIPGLQPWRLSLDAGANAIAIGYAYDASGYENAVIVRLSGADGSISWTYTYDGGGQYFDDVAEALSTDAAGNVFVAGTTSSLNGYNWWVLKLAAADGSLLWGPVTAQLGVSLNMATDPHGDIVVTGEDDSYAMATVKYAGGSGAVLWGPMTLASAGGWYAVGHAVAVDPSGDAFVSGDSSNDGSTTDFVTMKYRGTDGATLWGPAYFDGEAHGSDSVYLLGLELDAQGNPVVGGSSRTIDRYYDLAILKYDGTTGATLWGPVYAGGPDDEFMAGFSVDGNSVAAAASSSGAYLTIGLDESFGLADLPPDPPTASCQIPYAFTFVAENGTTPYTWGLVGGQLPPGMTLSSTGILSGTPDEEGFFQFTIGVSDAAARVIHRDFSIVIAGRADPYRRITVNYADPCSRTLSFPGGTSYLWLPGGETTPEIVVSPVETTTYGLVVSDGLGCPIRHSVTIPGITLTPECSGPSMLSVSPPSGPAEGGSSIAVSGLNFEAAATLLIGGQPAGNVVVVDPTQITATVPALDAGHAYPVTAFNPDGGNASLTKGWFADFLDVPPSNIFHRFIATLTDRGVTAGCGAGNYCPDAPATRAQMAAFLLRSEHGPFYSPPACFYLVFSDVPCDDPFAPWINQLYAEGVTTGCGNGNYCPTSAVTRAQMSVFLLKTRNTSAYYPPPATGIFGDVPVTDPFAPWIEDIYHQGITGGCSASPLLYCPSSPTTRGQMAVFLVKTFELQ